MSNPSPDQIASEAAADLAAISKEFACGCEVCAHAGATCPATSSAYVIEIAANRRELSALRSASLADKAELEKAKAEDFMKKWCRHIKWDSYVQYDARTTCHVNTPAWVIYCPTPSSSELPVPRSWKVCPVCGAERPTKANTKAAAHCALMDMGDDE